MTSVLHPKIDAFLKNLTQAFQHSFKHDLVGLYLHGSGAMGCYHPDSSDIDVLVVINRNLTIDERKTLSTLVLDLSSSDLRLEISVITQDALNHFEHPTPYEFHYSEDWRERYRLGQEDFSLDHTDPDLAGHLMITKYRGVCVFGAPINTVFPDIPEEHYLDSIAADAKWSFNNVMKGDDAGECRMPPYAVLNFCRVLAYIQDKQIISKDEGGQWGLMNLPGRFAPVIREALHEYRRKGSSKPVDCQLLKAFASHAYAIINQANAKFDRWPGNPIFP